MSQAASLEHIRNTWTAKVTFYELRAVCSEQHYVCSASPSYLIPLIKYRRSYLPHKSSTWEAFLHEYIECDVHTNIPIDPMTKSITSHYNFMCRHVSALTCLWSLMCLCGVNSLKSTRFNYASSCVCIWKIGNANYSHLKPLRLAEATWDGLNLKCLLCGN